MGYRKFLIRDCGEMTIEGADMDTAQRRFDLEKLFVPSNGSAGPKLTHLATPKLTHPVVQ